MRTRNTYKFSGSVNTIEKLRQGLINEHLKFTVSFISSSPCQTYCDLWLTLNISNDMITEVEELLHEIAEKTGVRIE